jgi:NAD-dependent DNA ligase
MENKDKKKTKKLKPNIILVEEEMKPRKKTRKVKAKPNIEFIIVEEEKEKEKEKEKGKEKIKVKKERKTRKKINKEKELITNYPDINEQHKLEGIGNIKEPIEDIIIPKVSKEKSLKTMQVKQIEMNKEPGTNAKKYNDEFIDILDKLSNIMLKQGEPFRARAYQKAQESIMAYPNDITSPSQLKGLPGIGDTIMDKFNEYVETGTLKVLEREKNNPVNILADVYGIGPKKAKELVEKGISNIEQLRARQDELLNDIQKVGLKYYEEILERIPRTEIEEYEKLFQSAFEKVSSNEPNSRFEIVGSYRRGAQNSGDIDVIITSESGTIYKNFIDELIKQKIITNVLSRGLSKTLVIAKLPGNRVSRRIDFLYSPPEEFPFAILYFTGSKAFNTVMRQKALEQGYTLNEHGLSLMENKVKGQKVAHTFNNEKDIFDFLKMVYKTPIERQNGRAVNEPTLVPEEPVIIAPTSVKEQPTSVKEQPTSVKEQPIVETIVAPTLVKAETKKKVTRKKKIILVEEPATEVLATEVVAEENVVVPPDIIHNLERFKHEGITILDNLSEKTLIDMIRYSSKVYYNFEPFITDNQYDIIKEYTNNKFPSNMAVTEIGSDVIRNKAQLPYEMASMDKIKPDTGALNEWVKKYKGPYVLSCKLDGVSGLYTTEGDQPKLYTRGNGSVGQDISYLIPHLKLPKTKGIVIRGEFVILKSVFETKYKDKFANPRNMVAGIINHKTINETVKDIHFVSYETIMPSSLSPSKQMEFLGTINVERVQYKIETALTNEALSDLLVDWRTNYIYEIDGVIVTNDAVYPRTSGNPDYSFAFKMVLSDQMAEAKVVDVIWTPSKDGLLKPRVRIEPIHLGGVQIEYATGFNGAFISNNNIGIGTIIELIRSGDVIPHIKSVTVPAPEPKMPLVPYKWNESHVDIMLENASEDPTVKEKNITGFFKGIEVDGLGSGNVAKIIASGHDTVGQILKMSEADFLQVDGFQKKLAAKIYQGIRDKIEKASLVTIMSASNVFGHGFSDTRLGPIMSAEPDILTSTESKLTKIQKIADIKGIAAKSATAFVDKIPDFLEFIKETGLEYKILLKQASKELEVPVAINHALNGKTIVVTGLTEKVIEDKVKAVGAKFGSSVSKNTDILVAKSVEESSGKLDKARELNKTLAKPIQIISLDEFLKLV